MSHLYVCLFSNGHIKVGRSINPMARIAAHEERVSCLGVELVEHRVFECVGHVIPAEAELIRWCDESASKTNKNEWFEGLDFMDVCGLAEKVSCLQFEAPEQAKKLPIEQACDLVGSQRKLSALLSVKPAAVNQWCLGRRPVPVHHCKAIAGATNDKVTCKDLRPDDWHLIWPDLAEPATQKAEAPHAA